MLKSGNLEQQALKGSTVSYCPLTCEMTVCRESTAGSDRDYCLP